MGMEAKKGFFLGKKPARPGAVLLMVGNYVDLDAVKLPDVFSHAHGYNLGMLGNDRVGDCVIADMIHRIMIFASGTKRPIPWFNDATAIALYSRITGYNPRAPLDENGENPTDQGTDMEEAERWWRHYGIADANSINHGIKAYGSIAHHSMDHLLKAAYLFGAVGIGVRLPQSAVDAMDEPPVVWAYHPGSPSVGGHAVTLTGRTASGNYELITWGQIVEATPKFMARQLDEALCSFSQEYLMATGKSPELFDEAALDADLKSVT